MHQLLSVLLAVAVVSGCGVPTRPSQVLSRYHSFGPWHLVFAEGPDTIYASAWRLQLNRDSTYWANWFLEGTGQYTAQRRHVIRGEYRVDDVTTGWPVDSVVVHLTFQPDSGPEYTGRLRPWLIYPAIRASRRDGVRSDLLTVIGGPFAEVEVYRYTSGDDWY